jgi:hypothetical protein
MGVLVYADSRFMHIVLRIHMCMFVHVYMSACARECTLVFACVHSCVARARMYMPARAGSRVFDRRCDSVYKAGGKEACSQKFIWQRRVH